MSQTLRATVTPNGWDAMLYVMTSCDPISCRAGVDGAPSGQPETTTFAATAAGSYYVVVDSPNANNKGPYSLVVSIE